VDSLSAARLHFMGYERETSPFMDGLAAESVVFAHAFAPSNVTPRSVAATMTGLHYSHIHRDLFDQRLPFELTTLAEWFQAHGFRTTGFNTNPHLTASTGFAQGFDAYTDVPSLDAPKVTLEGLRAEVARSYAPTASREFVYIHTMDVHHPYLPPAPHDSLFAPEPYRGAAVVAGDLRRPNGELVFGNLPWFAQSQDVREEDVAYLSSQLDGAIHYTDNELPALLAALRFDPTTDLLLVSADHGDQVFEHGYWLHGRTLLPEEIQVPLIVRWDGFPPHTIDAAVGLVDWFPTFAELFSFAPPQGLVGRSLLAALRGEELREVNPVWRAFASEQIRPRPDEVRHGPQLLVGAKTRATLVEPSKPLVLGARPLEPEATHLLTLEYRLSRGALEVALVRGGRGGVLFEHRILRAEEGWHELRAKVRPPVEHVKLRLRATGRVEIRSPALRRLDLPELAIVPWSSAVEVEDAPPLPEEKKAALRALGYGD